MVMTQATETKRTGTAVEQPPPLKISRTVHARRETVFKAWSSAEHVKAWFSPETYTVPDARVEMRVGGPFEVCMRAPDGQEHWTRGVFLEIKPNSRLVIDMRVTDAADQPLFTVRTEVDFADTLGGTRLDVMQTYEFIDPAMAAPMVAGASEGWRTTLDKLETEVDRGSRRVRWCTPPSIWSAPMRRRWRACGWP
jgi:uncharacterized protein YndB with AHSA1/START domain